VRHPIYTAVMVGVAGIALRSRTPIVLGMAALLVVFLGLKARWEERHLAEAFAEYETYRARTGRFLPRIGT
jgi:protein-S-isoprenylcysteine O-methyltransferase Ste14